MDDLGLLSSGLLVVATDVERTTGIRLVLTPWDDPAEGVAALLHTDTERPTHAVWETIGLLGPGAGLALHPPRAHPTGLASPYGDLSALDTAHDVADVAQQVTQMVLWENGSDPTWPPCPDHGGVHPLRPRLDTPGWDGQERPDRPVASVRWTCPSGGGSVPVGALAP
ncbi:hypothetical protein [Lapillicoccus jejuensis]|uniref:Uncharacterized protein n=1 Tax=Lapillicoccus jejuensis TaxID=402171 RepID=A0A542E0C7_9MICO|nr:hypothetical protein [Lapillicoccus jejuensis]TQJ08807.1 hypothetical protein FB458_1902 [Lapillicoccus jejuensis]